MAKSNFKPKVILAVAYARKSTDDERCEKSMADQNDRIAKLKPPEDGATYKIVRWYTRDKGVPGWKRGAERPDYHRLVNELAETKAKAILVDDMDRFSRAQDRQVITDVDELIERHGVRYIHAVNQGCFDLVQDPFNTFRIALAAMASHEHCTRLSRRVAEARKDAAAKGLRSGGAAPFGMQNVDAWGKPAAPGEKRPGHRNCKVAHGDPKAIEVIRWIFDKFAGQHWSMNSIASNLNSRKVPSPCNRLWHVKSVKNILTQPAYAGRFLFNRQQGGQFNVINDEHQVERVHRVTDEQQRNRWRRTPDEAVFVTEKTHQPIVPPKLFDKTQKMLDGFGKGARRPRINSYPLSGIVYCGHCQPKRAMYATVHHGEVVYRCAANSKHGSGTCGNYFIRQADILPFILRKLGEEIDALTLKSLQPKPPPPETQHERATEVQGRIAGVKAKIDAATENLMFASDPRTRQVIDAKLKALWAEHDSLAKETADDKGKGDWVEAELARMVEWWSDFKRRSVHVPVDPAEYPDLAAYHEAWGDGTPRATAGPSTPPCTS